MAMLCRSGERLPRYSGSSYKTLKMTRMFYRQNVEIRGLIQNSWWINSDMTIRGISTCINHPLINSFFFVALGLGFTQTMDVHDISKAVGAFLFLVFGIIGRVELVELVELATWGEGWNPLPKKQSIWTYESKWCPSISLYNLRYFLVYIHTYI